MAVAFAIYCTVLRSVFSCYHAVGGFKSVCVCVSVCESGDLRLVGKPRGDRVVIVFVVSPVLLLGRELRVFRAPKLFVRARMCVLR